MVVKKVIEIDTQGRGGFGTSFSERSGNTFLKPTFPKISRNTARILATSTTKSDIKLPFKFYAGFRKSLVPEKNVFVRKPPILIVRKVKVKRKFIGP